MQRSKSGKYVVRYRQGGKHKSRSFDRESDAIAFKAEVTRRRQTGGMVLSRADVPTVKAEATSWLAGRTDLAPSTEALYADTIVRLILPELGGYNLLDLRPRILEEWQSKIAKDAGTRAAQIAYNVLSQTLDRAVAHELIEDNKLRYVKRTKHKKRVKEAATPEQVEALRAHFIAAERPRHATFVSLIAYVGLRPPQEPLGLMWADLEDRILFIRRRNVYGRIEPLAKGGRRRRVTVPDPVWTELTELRLRLGKPSGLILPGKSGQPLTRTAWQGFTQGAWSRARKAAKLPDNFTPYDLRHTCASLMLASGVPLPLVARQLGHSIDQCVRDYAHLIDGLDERAPSLEEQIRKARAA